MGAKRPGLSRAARARRSAPWPRRLRRSEPTRAKPARPAIGPMAVATVKERAPASEFTRERSEQSPRTRVEARRGGQAASQAPRAQLASSRTGAETRRGKRTANTVLLEAHQRPATATRGVGEDTRDGGGRATGHGADGVDRSPPPGPRGATTGCRGLARGGHPGGGCESRGKRLRPYRRPPHQPLSSHAVGLCA